MPIVSDSNADTLSERVMSIIPIINGQGTNSLHYRIERYLIILCIATQDYSYNGEEFDKLYYFTISKLGKIASSLFTPIKYDRSRIALKIYKICQKYGYVNIKKVNGDTYVAVTKKGQDTSQKMIKNLILKLPQEMRPTQTQINKVEISGSSPSSSSISPQNQQVFLDYNGYRMRTDIDPLLKYKKFVSREYEIQKLFNFLGNIKKKIMIITGKNGIGKTRLVLEFARQLQSKNKRPESDYWHIYFIHPNRDFIPVSLKGPTLLVLDDGIKYQDLDKLIDFVLNAQSENDIKLLVTVSSLFTDSVKSQVKERNFEPDIMQIDESDIRGFLRANFDWIDENLSIGIETVSRNSFVYAIIYAEYFKEKGVSEEPYKILSWKKAKYIADIAEKTRCSIDDVEYVIDLISLAMPLDWTNDKEYLKTVLPNQNTRC